MQFTCHIKLLHQLFPVETDSLAMQNTTDHRHLAAPHALSAVCTAELASRGRMKCRQTEGLSAPCEQLVALSLHAARIKRKN